MSLLVTEVSGQPIDIDECADDNGGCADTCTNKDGTFECGCPPGYALGPNFVNCTGKTVLTTLFLTCMNAI